MEYAYVMILLLITSCQALNVTVAASLSAMTFCGNMDPRNSVLNVQITCHLLGVVVEQQSPAELAVSHLATYKTMNILRFLPRALQRCTVHSYARSFGVHP